MIRCGKSAGKGRGIFATRRISRGKRIEEVPVVVVPHKQLPKIKATVLGAYYFEWGDDDEDGAILFGLCQLCNHSYEPNARFVEHHARKTMEFIALRDIPKGSEVTINYNGELGCVDQLKFRVRR